MELRRFGTSDLFVSPLGFGAGHIGAEQMTDREAVYLLEQARDLGINLIDTARGYGLSEQRVGQFLKNRRHDVILSTKVGYDVPGTQDWTFEAVHGGIDQALQTMQTDYLDIVHLHSCSREILAQGDVIEALDQAKQAGKVRVIAYSGDREDLTYAIETNRFDSFQHHLICLTNVSMMSYLRFRITESSQSVRSVMPRGASRSVRSDSMSNLTGNVRNNSLIPSKNPVGLRQRFVSRFLSQESRRLSSARLDQNTSH